MSIDLDALRSRCRVLFPKFTRYGYLGVEILQQLKGQPYDEAAVALISLFEPNWIRVTDGEITTDGDLGTRVTVVLDKDTQLIESIHFGGRVGLPDGIQHGGALQTEFRRRGIELGGI